MVKNDGVDYTAVVFGRHARHVPAWLYVQDAGPGMVSFVGASRVDALAHPLRYGSTLTHQLIVGELVVRPHTVHTTDQLRGVGLAALMTSDYQQVALGGEQLISLRSV